MKKIIGTAIIGIALVVGLSYADIDRHSSTGWEASTGTLSYPGEAHDVTPIGGGYSMRCVGTIGTCFTIMGNWLHINEAAAIMPGGTDVDITEKEEGTGGG